MKGIWRKCLSLSLGFLVAGARAGEPVRLPPPSVPSVIARSASAEPVAAPVQGPAATLGRPLAVTLERPRAVAAPAAADIQLTSFRTDLPTTPQPIVRGQMADRQPLPPGPGGLFATDAAPVSPFAAPYASPPPPPPPGFGAPYVPPPPAPPDDLTWDAHDRFGCGDGVMNCYNNRFYFASEYLMWWMRGNTLPPLVNISGPGPMALTPGMGTETVYGGNSVGHDTHSGYRFRAGYWIDGDHTLGLEATYFFLAQTSSNFTFGSGGVPVAGVPFLNAVTGTPANLIFAAPGAPGSASGTLASRLWGYEINLRGNLWGGCNGHIDLIGGYRALGLDDQFGFGVGTTVPGGPMPTNIVLRDSFATRNRFAGGQLGLGGEYRFGRWSVDGAMKVAIGNSHEELKIYGNNVLNGMPGSGGIFAQASNSRNDSRDRFAVVPELTLNLGYQLTDHLRAYIGYNFLYWSNVGRVGDQIPRTLNPGQLLSGPNNPPQAPAFAFKGTDFWVQGVTFGLEFRY